jgi:hypothetical protein
VSSAPQSRDRASLGLGLAALLAVGCCAAPGVVALAGGLGGVAVGGLGGLLILTVSAIAVWRLRRRRRVCDRVPKAPA